ncbi:MAG: hypothetical protein DCC51_12555 [Anaerolineae bacterium]|nr:MAG: hypothetical protein DCC51_12555 [Anaerolineae bacterium]
MATCPPATRLCWLWPRRSCRRSPGRVVWPIGRERTDPRVSTWRGNETSSNRNQSDMTESGEAGPKPSNAADAIDEQANPGTSYEPVWTFRGYKMRPSEFNTAMTHYYRAEIQRSNVWRSRLDMTTNWAVVTVAAAITFVFAAPENHWGVFLLVMLLTVLFLSIEARRYRYYELWSLRARLMETDFFAAMLVPPFAPHAEWNETLAESLLQPEFPISRLEAIGRRLRNNYLAIFSILEAAIPVPDRIHHS